MIWITHSCAVDLHELKKKLGYKNIDLAGHDIGMIVAYAYAAQFPDEVKKIALMDALLPGVEPVWSQVKAQAWWFGFFSQPHSGADHFAGAWLAAHCMLVATDVHEVILKDSGHWMIQ